jgi:hypothetical protein
MWRHLEERGFVGRLGVGARIILEWVVKRTSGRGLESSGSRQGQLVGCSEYCDEHAFAIKLEGRVS